MRGDLKVGPVASVVVAVTETASVWLEGDDEWTPEHRAPSTVTTSPSHTRATSSFAAASGRTCLRLLDPCATWRRGASVLLVWRTAIAAASFLVSTILAATVSEASI